MTRPLSTAQVALAWLATICLASAAPAADVPDDKIAHWVKNLDAPSFDVRESATEQLVRAGKAAVAPVEQAVSAAASSGRVEVAFRGMQVLRDLAISGDPETAKLAEDSLRRRAKVDKASDITVAQAKAALFEVGQARQEEAAKILQAAGAEIGYAQVEMGGHFGATVLELRLGDGWKGGEAELRNLQYLVDVQQVVLQGPKVTDAVLERLSWLKGIVSLSIKKGAISDAGLASIAKLNHLDHLSLMYMPLTDAGIAQLQFGQFTTARLYGTKLSKDYEARLKKTLADAGAVTRLDVRRGAFLGIAGQPGGGGCQIYNVVAGSPAAQGGMQERDVILKYEGKEVVDFESLTGLIAQNIPGDKVMLEIDRFGEKQKVPIELGEWDVSRATR